MRHGCRCPDRAALRAWALAASPLLPCAQLRGCQVRGTDTRVRRPEPVARCFSVAMGKTNKNKPKAIWGGKDFFRLLLPDHGPVRKEAESELKAETEAAATGGLQRAGLLPLACSATFLIQPRPTYPKTGQQDNPQCSGPSHINQQ